jgi:hypothetical protein
LTQTDVAQVYICEDINWGGECEYKITKPGGSDMDCTQLNGTESSIQPDPDFFCEFYTYVSQSTLLIHPDSSTPQCEPD